MAELWQAYGSWVLYAVLLLSMLWMHGGLGRRGKQGSAGGHAHGHAHGNPQDPRSLEGSSTASAVQADRSGHNHGRGCC